MPPSTQILNNFQLSTMAPFCVCQLCGSAAEGSSRCSGCKEVWYCSKEHQKLAWGRFHKPVCRYVQQHPEAVFIQVEAGEGNGLSNRMTNHVFENKSQGLTHVSEAFQGRMSRPLKSPFAELLGWHLEFYCSTNENEMRSGMMPFVGKQCFPLNGAGIFLGCDLQSGISRYNNLSGEIFVCGRRASDGNLRIVFGAF